jgi:hypothetical protein
VSGDDFATLVERLRKLGATRVTAGDMTCELPPVPVDARATSERIAHVRMHAETAAERERIAKLEESARMLETLP